MHTTFSPPADRSRDLAGAATFSMRVGVSACSVRAFPVAAIQELLGFDHELEDGVVVEIDPGTVADALESRMIAPPRPRRRRDRAVSSRAVFFGG